MNRLIILAVAVAVMSGCASTSKWQGQDAYDYVDGYTHGCSLARGNVSWGGDFNASYQDGLNNGFYDCCAGRRMCTETIGHEQAFMSKYAGEMDRYKGRKLTKQSWLMENPNFRGAEWAEMPSRTLGPKHSSGSHE